MNTISLHSTNKNFITSIISVAEKNLNGWFLFILIYMIIYFLEEETDLWILTKIGFHVMNSFCNNVGNVSQIDIQLARQFNADVG